MPFHIINMSLQSGQKIFFTDELNNFCLNKRILGKEVKFFMYQDEPFWSVFLQYENMLERTTEEPEAQGLTEAGRLCFQKLKEWRKETAEKEGIPPFVIAKNSALVDLIKKETKTLEALKQIHGFGEKKIQKYGKDIIAIVGAFFSAASQAHKEAL